MIAKTIPIPIIIITERKKLDRSHLAFFARFKSQMKPFVTKTVLDSFKALRKDELAAAND